MSFRCAIPLLLLPRPALAHEAAAGLTDAAQILPPLLVAAGLYCAGVFSLWRRAGHLRGLGPGRVSVFLAGLGLVGVLLLSPLDGLAEQALSVHMIQHFGLMLVAAPLLVLGRPGLAFLWALPFRARRPAARLGDSRLWRGATHPFGGWIIYLVALWVWHAPPLHQAALANEWVHAAQHASFLGAGLVFWSSVLAPRRLERRAGAFLAIFATAVQSCALAALITTASAVWYPAYGPSPLGLSALADQQLGGLIMWAPCCALLIGAALGTFARLLREVEGRAEGTPS